MQSRSLEAVQLEAAAGGRPDSLLGVVVEVHPRQPATGRGKREVHGRHATHPWGKGGRGRGPHGVRGRRPQRWALCVCRLRVGCARTGRK